METLNTLEQGTIVLSSLMKSQIALTHTCLPTVEAVKCKMGYPKPGGMFYTLSG